MTGPMRIVCVDDDKTVLQELGRMFRHEAYEPLLAGSGPEGLAILSARPAQIVLSNYSMPGMNGVEFLRACRALRPDTVRCMLSEPLDALAIVDAINEGHIHKFIHKPCDDAALKLQVADAAALWRRRAAKRQAFAELKDQHEKLLSLHAILKERITFELGALKTENKELSLYATTLLSLPVAVVCLSDREWITYFNEKSKQLFGWTEKRLLPAKRSELMDRDLNALIDRMLSQRACTASAELRGRRMEIDAVVVARTTDQERIALTFVEHEQRPDTGVEQNADIREQTFA
jgi:CheY-like chemotaxis protein